MLRSVRDTLAEQRAREHSKVRYLFEGYALDTDRRELRLGADLVPLEPQVFDVLAYLIQNRASTRPEAPSATVVINSD